MSRFAREGRVFFFEEPVFEDVEPQLRSSVCPKTGVRVQTPVLPCGLDHQDAIKIQKRLLKSMLEKNTIRNYISWYYTPMAREFTSELKPQAIVYDCMDELSCFAGAPAAMRSNELALFKEADLVFTGGATLFESKRKQHSSVHLFPSSVDILHFSRARKIRAEPEDQARIPKPRLGYAGVIDERMDLDLIHHISNERPEWQIVLLGPVVKIDPAVLPRAANIHYLGMKQYAELPAYLAGWQIGLLPFALNESTRFISPTKTPEYLAAGLQVISTAIRDVVSPYGEKGLVGIARTNKEFVRLADAFIARPPKRDARARVDAFISQSSWDKTWSDMNDLIEGVLNSAEARPVVLPSLPQTDVARV